ASDKPQYFHDWRKRVKDLWYQLRLLESAWPDMMHAYDNALDELADLLGDHQDLDLLHDALDAMKADEAGQDEDGGIAICGVDAKTCAATRLLVEKRMNKLRRAARPIAKRIYSEKPGVFVDRLNAYWRCWRKK
ncbi:MAG: CHAD domain-containing protein, partial [Rhodospirillales bacterium]|nr:CHAD domain-containing protein [Rhodospirillales bacterium]